MIKQYLEIEYGLLLKIKKEMPGLDQITVLIIIIGQTILLKDIKQIAGLQTFFKTKMVLYG